MGRGPICSGATPTTQQWVSKTAHGAQVSSSAQYLYTKQGHHREVHPRERAEDGGSGAPADEPGVPAAAQQHHLHHLQCAQLLLPLQQPGCLPRTR